VNREIIKGIGYKTYKTKVLMLDNRSCLSNDGWIYTPSSKCGYTN